MTTLATGAASLPQAQASFFFSLLTVRLPRLTPPALASATHSPWSVCGPCLRSNEYPLSSELVKPPNAPKRDLLLAPRDTFATPYSPIVKSSLTNMPLAEDRPWTATGSVAGATSGGTTIVGAVH